MLNKSDQVIYMRAFDISEHFRANWQGTGFKAQLVAPNKASALKYQACLNEIGVVSSEVVISPPDLREGYMETDDEPTDEVVKFWQKMMKRYGSEEEYTKQLINQFKHGSDPEILIVVDKLLTGFDAPRNTVLYLCRVLREHTLLQAIARVNRIFEGKEFGFIVDYANVLGELDKALTMYSAFEGFDEADLAGTLTSINSEIEKLPTRYSDLWELFKTVKHSKDEEAYERLLADDELRRSFTSVLQSLPKLFAIALSSEKFLTETDEKTLSRYKSDLRKFQSLRASVQLRFAEAIDYRMYEPKIRKLLDTHIQADEVIQLNLPVNIFDDDMFSQVKEDQGVYQKGKTMASRADTIAHATKKAITERMDEDPAFYEKFSRLIQQQSMITGYSGYLILSTCTKSSISGTVLSTRFMMMCRIPLPEMKMQWPILVCLSHLSEPTIRTSHSSSQFQLIRPLRSAVFLRSTARFISGMMMMQRTLPLTRSMITSMTS